ncbi:DNA topoisomerase IB [Actinosynnema mirum]|uniref:DNA topoisomerase n=1 Tax=Actinosynnema mirum (strain ATCC 29888 / DSM 43827 / JCM 3225 / NBRC 14064 / NCIMB 13271 / NRRL B-12336 / IMRU 3971 / 101) TaxID=446462 RepID=C6WPB6_ACTMD|nr:DNA topoisomerase IB [Actinosynnema mirum]ACU38618.1 DNA topoisomerase IB [Actinosynnema mirum DSM 43827]
MRLRRSTPGGPGFGRRRRGGGFGYADQDGARLTDAEHLARIKALVIPPAWRQVWISPHHNGHIQAVGVDEAGRRQYLYHEAWRRERDEEKHARVLALAPLLPEFRARIARDLRGRDRALPLALTLLERGAFRVGGESYAEDNGSHGVATLLCSHVTVRGSAVDFRYPAKSGVRFTATVEDDAVARTVRLLLRGRKRRDRLLVRKDGGQVRSDDVNVRFKELVGEEFSVKDLRTWHATVVAARAFAAAGDPGAERGRRRVEAEVMREVALRLGNTPAVARKSYVDPRLVELFRAGKVLRVRGKGREAEELAVLRLLR